MSGSSYPFADALIVVKNRCNPFVMRTVEVPYSKFVASVLLVLKEVGYIIGTEVFEERKGVKKIKVLLRFNKQNKNIVRDVKIVSKPGCRIYASVEKLRMMKNEDSARIVILSTSKGIMTVNKALEQGLGGEVLCKLFD